MLITGANGQLAQAFARILSQENITFFIPCENELDVTVPSKVDEALHQHAPDVVINCAAYNFVDEAQRDPQAAFRVNADAVGVLASACQKKDIFFVHYSSDYVFDGNKLAPYREEDVPHPVNEYGKSKLSGEKVLQDMISRYLIFRLSWVFGLGGNNFLTKLMRWAKDKPVLEIADNEVSVPSWTDDIVHLTLQSLEQGLYGLYHLTNSGSCSRYEWARFFFTQMGFDNKIIPVKKEIFDLPAKRPDFSAMTNEKLVRDLACPIPSWQEAVECFSRQLKKER